MVTKFLLGCLVEKILFPFFIVFYNTNILPENNGNLIQSCFLITFSIRNIEFTVGALTVDPQVASYDPSSLVPYMEELGVEYIYEEVPIFANAQKLTDLR